MSLNLLSNCAVNRRKMQERKVSSDEYFWDFNRSNQPLIRSSERAGMGSRNLKNFPETSRFGMISSSSLKQLPMETACAETKAYSFDTSIIQGNQRPNLYCIKMTDYLLNSNGHIDMDDLKVKNSEIPHSIVNSVTNDEDDWANSKHNSGRSILRSVTNDDDDSIEPEDNRRHNPMPDQQYPLNYQPEFPNRGTMMINDVKHTESTELPKPSLPMFRQDPFERNLGEKKFFLIRYEHMMMDQEKEQRSTISHLKFFLKLLMDLQADTKGEDSECHPLDDEISEECFLTEFTIEDLKQAYEKLKNSPQYDVLKTDKQFLMVLDILCDDDKYGPTDIHTPATKDSKISWAEIIQCYRNCITGMQTLEQIGANSTIRNRAKERTLALLSGYRKSSFASSSPSTTKSVPAKTLEAKICDDKVSRIDQQSHSEPQTKGLLNHPLVSFFVGAVIGGLLVLGQSSYSQTTIQLNLSSSIVKEPLYSPDESLSESMAKQTGDSDAAMASSDRESFLPLDSSKVIAADYFEMLFE